MGIEKSLYEEASVVIAASGDEKSGVAFPVVIGPQGAAGGVDVGGKRTCNISSG
jgi:hypothetical protein